MGLATHLRIASLSLLAMVAWGQQVGNWIEEVHPKLTTWECTVKGGCVAQNTSIVLDSKYRWLHQHGSNVNCMNNSMAVTSTYCFDAETCHNNCFFEGANYTAKGIRTTNDDLNSLIHLNVFVGKNIVTPRVYLFNEDDGNYKMIALKTGMEFAFDVDVLGVGCKTQAALYLVEMNRTGGRSQYNEAGAGMGTGYCDSQCFVRDFHNGERNAIGVGSCCDEMDLFEATNDISTLVSHPCLKTNGPYGCLGQECAHVAEGGICSHYNCGSRAGWSDGFFGFGSTIDTRYNFTIVTQLFSGRDLGKTGTVDQLNQLALMRRFFIQNGTIYRTGPTRGTTEFDDQSCTSADPLLNGLALSGGLSATGRFLERGLVLSMSVFDFVKGIYPGLQPGTCEHGMTLEQSREFYYRTNVSYGNIRWGEMDSTYSLDGSSSWMKQKS